jgi:integrase
VAPDSRSEGRVGVEALRDRPTYGRSAFTTCATVASLLSELGVPLRMVTEILGHSQISTTSDIYTHVMPAQYGEVADALDAWLDGHGQANEDGGSDAV